jgi:plasmid maintenance system killer protein
VKIVMPCLVPGIHVLEYPDKKDVDGRDEPAMTGDRQGQWAMTVNDRWRICFEFRKGDAHEVEIVDYHRG